MEELGKVKKIRDLMCGRFTLYDFSKSKLNIKRKVIPNYNIVPNSNVLVIDRNNIITQVKWGISVSWSKKINIINARSETLDEKKIFSKTQRCIFLANGYFEWKRDKVKTPYYHTFKNNMLYFAGIKNGDEACIVTRQSYSNTNIIHERQPVILDYLDFDKWFLRNHNFECLNTKNLLIFRVSTEVNNPKNNTIHNILKK